MTAEIRAPEMGESIVEATVGRWLRQVGERVSAGEPVVELETEKVNVEVPAPQDGVLERILKQEGEAVAPGEVLGILAPVPAGVAPTPAPPPPPAPPQPAPAEEAPAEARATPLARRLAQEHGVDLSQVKGTGKGGRITQEDVARFLARATRPEAPPEAPAATPSPIPEARPAPPPIAPQPDRREERVPLTRRQLTMARRLTQVHQTAVMTTTFNEIDMSGVVELRRRWRERFRQRYGVDLGFMGFFVKAVVQALKEFPILNAEVQGEELVLKHYYDIGIAIGTEEGLVVPVLRDADRRSFAEIESAIAAMVERVRQHTLTLEELQGGTFTITNGGVFGSLLSTPILNPPQVGILGMHRIIERPVVVAGQVVVRPMMYVALTYDHRVVEGRQAVLFLVRVKELVEDPSRLLLSV